MEEKKAKRKLTVILSADVKGYSHLMQDDEEATVRTITAYREVMTNLIQGHDGRVVDAKGDNILAEFPSVVDAVRCGVEIQKELKVRNDDLTENRRMEFRIGINLGDVIEEKGTIYGDGVNIAARLEALADGGGICISGTAFDQIGKKLALGYEFLGEQTVKNIEKPVRAYKVLMEPEAVGKVIGEERPKPKQWLWAAIGAVAILIIAAGIFAVWNFYVRPDVEPASEERMAFPLPEKPSIAVLPFNNMSGDPKQGYLIDGLTENIISGLSKIPEMFVIARNSTFTYKDKPVKVQQVAEDLGVRYVLEGSVQISADQLRVTAQLVDALKGYHVWSEKYDRKMEDFFSVQDDITLNIAIALQGKLTEGEQAKIRHSTDNLEAWALAVEAHGLLETYARENIAKARELFKKAVEMDPNYAYAWTFLGWTYWVDGVYHSAHYDREQSFESALKMAQKAISIDTKSSDAHVLFSLIYLTQKKYNEAEAFGKKAIDLDPNSSENHGLVAITMQNIGKFEEAIALLKQAMRLDPYYPNWYLVRLGMCYRMVGMYEESVVALEEGFQRFRKGGTAPWDRAYLYLAATYSMMGRLEEARDCISKALEFNPKMSVDAWRKRLQYKDPQHTERILDALRKAGLPERPPLPLPDKPSIAVLPFVNMSGDPEQEYFSDGITEQIITSISKIPAIFVIARNSSFAYKNKSMKVQQIARELGVRYLIEGSIQRDNDKVRINAQLIDALSGKHIWAEDYDRKFEDIFAIQDEIAMEIMAALQIKLTLGAKADLKYDGTRNFEAYKKYLKARYHIIRRTKEDVHLGQQLAKEAIDIDPEYAAAYRFLGWSYLDEVWFGMTKTPAKSIKQAEQMAQKAIFLKGYQAPDYILLSGISLLKKDFDDAIEYGEKSVEFDPNNSNGHFILGMALRYEGQYKEAISKFEKAIRLSPIKQINYLNNLGWAYLLNKEYESAILIFNEAIQRNPDYLFAYMGLTAAYNLSGDKDKSNWAAENVLRVKPKFSLVAYEKRSPIKIEEDKKRIISAMRNAGLK